MSVLLKPRWLALHVFSVFVVVSCGGLAYWQFVRADAGSGRSFGYALQWPAIGIFGLGVWLWLCRDGVRGARQDPEPDAPDVVPEAEPARLMPPRLQGGVVLADGRTTVPVVDPAEDPELAEYNAMLARLAAKTRLQEEDAR